MTTSNAIQSVQKTRSSSAGGSAGRRQAGARRPAVARPPSYVNVPTSVAYAPVPDALVVTMVRILGLCWRNGYRRTPPLTLEQLARLLDRPRSTLHRHLEILERELGWLRRERQDRCFVLHPLPPFVVHPASGVSLPIEDADALEESERDVGRNSAHGTSVAVEPPANGHNCTPGTSEPSENTVSCSFAPAKLPGDERQPSHVAVEPPDRGQNASAADGPRPSPGLPGDECLQSHGVRQSLIHALADVGIENPARERIASDPAVEPAWVPAWQLWAQHPARANLSNPAGYIVRQLLHRNRPPETYLQLTRLSPDQMSKLRSSYWLSQEQLDLDPDLRAIRPLYMELSKDQIRG